MHSIRKLYQGTNVKIAPLSKYRRETGENVWNKLAKKASFYKKMGLVKHVLVLKVKQLMEDPVLSQFAHLIK